MRSWRKVAVRAGVEMSQGKVERLQLALLEMCRRESQLVCQICQIAFAFFHASGAFVPSMNRLASIRPSCFVCTPMSA